MLFQLWPTSLSSTSRVRKTSVVRPGPVLHAGRGTDLTTHWQTCRQTGTGLVSQAVPLSKACDVLRLLPGVVAACRAVPTRRRALLRSCLGKMHLTQRLVLQQQEEQLRRGYDSGRDDVAGSPACGAAAAAYLTALQGLSARLQLAGAGVEG